MVESLKHVGLSHRLDHYPSQLSGGEQQRVTIARAIANQPELLLLDEPTGDLDTMNSYKVLDLLVQLNKEGMTMIMVTHDMYLKNFANRVVWMRDGKISKVEDIDPVIRASAVDDLASKLKTITTSGTDATPIVTENVDPVNSSEPDKLPKSWKRTEIRAPASYKPVEFSEKKKHVRDATNYTAPSGVVSTLNYSPVKLEGARDDTSINSHRPAEKVDLAMTTTSPDSGFMSNPTSPPS
eukprot:Partr_v1_DN25490_c0_g1_i11_m53657 putative (ABC) transporter